MNTIEQNERTDGEQGKLVELAASTGEGVRELTPKQKRFTVRMWSSFIFLVAVFILGIGAWMTPSAKGLGTHAENLFLPPCGMYVMTGIPCPTCGCTTAVSHFAHGYWWQSLLTQPFGFMVGLAALAALGLGAAGAVTGRWYGPSMFSMQWYWQRWIGVLVGVLAGGWVYKIIMVKIAG